MNRIAFFILACLAAFPPIPAVAQVEYEAGWLPARDYGLSMSGEARRRERASEEAQARADYEAREIERRTAARERSDRLGAAAEAALGRGIEWTRYGIGLVEIARDLRDAYDALSELDREFDPDFEEGAPTVPSRCGESADCLDCYTSAVEKIDFNRFWIERARVITVSTIRFASSASSFGDSASSIHGVSGLAWQLQGKPQITEAAMQLRRTYRDKAEIYLDNIEQAMRELGRCEEEHYGEQDWYERFGYLYVSFMRAKYQGAAN